MLYRQSHHPRGSAILIAVGITGLIFTITVGLSVAIFAAFRSSNAIATGSEAYYAAEGAIEEALYMITGHGPGMQYDSSTSYADTLDGTVTCPAAATPYVNGATRTWTIDSRVGSIAATQLAPDSSTVLNLHRDASCPYEDQPIDVTDDALFVNLATTDFLLDMYYTNADCALAGDTCPTDIDGDTLIAEAGAILVAPPTDGVTAADRPITVTDDEALLDTPLQLVSDFRVFNDDGDGEYDASVIVNESLYDNVGGGGWGIIVNGGDTTPTLPSPGTVPFASNVSADTTELYEVPYAGELLANLFVDVDDSGTVTPALVGRWKASAEDDVTNNDTTIQYDIDRYLATEEGSLPDQIAPITTALFDTDSTSNRDPLIGTAISALLDTAYHQPTLTLYTFEIPLWYRVNSNNLSDAEPIPTTSVVIQAEGASGPSIQILETNISQEGRTPIFDRTTVF